MGRVSDARKRLLDAAHDLIWNFSYGAVTVEAICAQAKVRKGTFYHFFDSKSELAQAAVLAWWDERSRLIEGIFRPEVPPLERIAAYLDFVAGSQIAAYQANGRVPGCPLFTLGSEICHQGDELAEHVRRILRSVARNFETAVADAWQAGEIGRESHASRARLLWAFYEGALTHARIENDPEWIRNLKADALTLLGANRSPAGRAAAATARRG
jgi:TetR/AcrR family transcriptional repressor of nem operon